MSDDRKKGKVTAMELELDEMLFESFCGGLPHQLYKKHIDKRNTLIAAERARLDNQQKAGKAPKSVIPEITRDLLAKNPGLTAQELWPMLYAELGEAWHNPDERCDNQGNQVISYTTDNGEKTITYRRFANIISEMKKK